MASFITNLFPSKHENNSPAAAPALQSRSSQNDVFTDTPGTPTRNSFITPVQTPQGSPSKNRNPPGANELPIAFENAMKLTTANFGSPSKSGRTPTESTPLSPSKSNALAVDDSYFGQVSADDSVLHKSVNSPGSPLRKQGQENTPPTSRLGAEPVVAQNQAALSRNELYQLRDQREQTVRKYNTQRGLTAEELEILQKPNVKRLANVTQLCTYHFLAFRPPLLTSGKTS
jgi:cell cycle protein kinase DBF2